MGWKTGDLEKKGLLSREYGAGCRSPHQRGYGSQAARKKSIKIERENSESESLMGDSGWLSLTLIIDRLREGVILQYHQIVTGSIGSLPRLKRSPKGQTLRVPTDSCHPCLQPRIRTFPIQWALIRSFFACFFKCNKRIGFKFQIVTPRGNIYYYSAGSKTFHSKLMKRDARVSNLYRKKRELHWRCPEKNVFRKSISGGLP